MIFIWELVDSIPLLLWVMELIALREAAHLSRRLPHLVKLSLCPGIKSSTLLGKLGNELPFSIAYLNVYLCAATGESFINEERINDTKRVT